MRTPKEIGKDITECKNNLSVLNYELIAYWQEFHAKQHGVIQGNLVSVNGKKYVISGLYSNFY